MTWVFNPFTGALDWDNSTAAIDACIKKDGTTTTTARIPFQFGWSVPNDTQCFIGSEGAYVRYNGPEEPFPGLLWEAAGQNMSFYANNVEFTSSGTTRFIGNSAFSGRPSLNAGALLASNQTLQFGDSSRYAQWVSASSRLETLATGASDTLRLGARSKAQIDLTNYQALTADATDAVGSIAFDLTQSTALSYQAGYSNSRRLLRIKEGTDIALELLPSNIETGASGYKSCCLNVPQINLRPGVAPSSSSLINASQSYTNLTTSKYAVYGLFSASPGANGLSMSGLNFGLLTYGSPTYTWGNVTAADIMLQTPTGGTFNPTSGPATALKTYIRLNDSASDELSVIDNRFDSLGTYSPIGKLVNNNVKSNLGGVYGTVDEQIGMWVHDVVGAYATTARAYGLKIDAFGANITAKWGVYSDEDIAVASGAKVIYEGSATAKGDTYHTYNTGTLETWVGGTKVMSATGSLITAHVATSGFGGSGGGFSEELGFMVM